jgi:hypothetical protein
MSSLKELPTGFLNQQTQLEKSITGHYAPFFHPGSDPAPSSLAGGAVLRTSATAKAKRSAVGMEDEIPQSCAN